MPGVIFELVVLLVCFGVVGISIRAAKAGKVPKVRKIAALEGLPELVGRAAEMGSCVHFMTGAGGLNVPSYAAQATAGLSILGHVAELCGKYKVPIHYTCIYGYNIAIAQDLIRTGYLRGGHPELYRDDMIFYSGEHQYSYAPALMGFIMREKPAANMMFGEIMYETMNTIGAGAIAGSMQAAGTINKYYQCFLVSCCDFAMIGDELFAAAASLRGIPDELGGLRGADMIKMISLGLAALAIALASAGSDLFLQISKM